MDKVYEGAEGLTITVDCGIDLTTATSVYLEVQRPDGSETIWEAEKYTKNGVTKYIRHVTLKNDLNIAGVYILHSRYITDTKNLPGDSVRLEVEALFS
jgi:hypothetical protein